MLMNPCRVNSIGRRLCFNGDQPGTGGNSREDPRTQIPSLTLFIIWFVLTQFINGLGSGWVHSCGLTWEPNQNLLLCSAISWSNLVGFCSGKPPSQHHDGCYVSGQRRRGIKAWFEESRAVPCPSFMHCTCGGQQWRGFLVSSNGKQLL